MSTKKGDLPHILGTQPTQTGLHLQKSQGVACEAGWVSLDLRSPQAIHPFLDDPPAASASLQHLDRAASCHYPWDDLVYV